MRPMTRQPALLRHAGRTIAGTVLALSLFAIQPPGLAQDDRGGEHWVGTWATAAPGVSSVEFS